jgi:hypothetical protein
MEVSSRRVSSTHAWRARLSRRSEKSSRTEAGRGVTTRSLVWDQAATVLTLADAFLVGLEEVALAAAAGLGAGFLGLAVFLVAITFGCSGASVTG